MKKYLILGIAIIIIFIIILGFIFPYSFFSLNKTIEYTPSNLTVKQINLKLSTFNKENNLKINHPADEAVNDAISYISQSWITSNKKSDISINFVANQINQIEKLENEFTKLVVPEVKYNDTAQSYLFILIDNFRSFINEFYNIKERFNTKNEIKTRLSNLHASFYELLAKINVFYEESKNK